MNPINRSDPLYDQVYEALWSRIVSGEIKPGTRLSDLQWSTKLNVSRTPVREAMRKLQQDGVLLPLSRGGYEVLRINAHDLQRLYRCRAVLESLAVREAAENISKSQLGKLALLFNQTEKALIDKKFDRAFKLNTQFHQSIVQFCGNPYLQSLLSNLSRMILFARSSLMMAAHEPQIELSYAEHLQGTQKDHREILELLQAGDAEGAARRMEEHLFVTGQNMGRISMALAEP
jgi:DNA-binding GntR family transcriptional regulator